MESWLPTIIILAIIFWCIARTGPRRAQRAHRQLTARFGGHYVAGWTQGQTVALIPHGEAEIQVRLRCTAWHSEQCEAEFIGPWSADRPELPLTEPERLELPRSESRPISDELRGVASRLRESESIEQVWWRAMRGKFVSRAVLRSADPERMTEWFRATLRLYSLLLAETAAGIEFSAARKTASGEQAHCQVCGLPANDTEIVACPNCGAPHHADCWNYNRGCAIYGCK